MITASLLNRLREEDTLEILLINVILGEHVNYGNDTLVYIEPDKYIDPEAELLRLTLKFNLLGFSLEYQRIPETSNFFGGYILVRVSWG